MTQAQAMLDEALKNRENALKAAEAAKTKKARRMATAEAEFWGNKAAAMQTTVENLESGKW